MSFFSIFSYIQTISPSPSPTPPRQETESLYFRHREVWIFWEKSALLFYLSQGRLKIQLKVTAIFKHRVPPVVANFFKLLGLYSQFEKVLLIRNIDITGNLKIIFMPIVTLILRLRANGLFHSSVKKTTFWVKKGLQNPWLFLLSSSKGTSIRMQVKSFCLLQRIYIEC